VVHSPYTPFFGDAFMAAHIAIGMMLVALLWWTLPDRPGVRVLFFIAIGLVVTAPVLGDFVRGFGAKELVLTAEHDALLFASIFVFVALLSLRRFAIGFAAVLMAASLLELETRLLDSMTEICALHLVWIGVVLGLVRRRARVDDTVSPALPVTKYVTHDVLIFAIATVAAALTSIFVLSRADGSADEWAYTWQAAVFAKAHVYGTPPPCENAFQAFYVFESTGRLFAQYTPGWPLFMAPFVAMGVPWLAGPFSHGLMAVGVARVARTAVRLDAHGTRQRERAAGWVAGLVATFGTTILLCGASRYPHVFVAAMFAWSIEALFVVATEGDRDRKFRYGVLLGSCVALMGAARPPDGAMLATGLALYFLYALVRRRVGARAFLGAFAGFAFWGGLTLLILRVQLGSWFTTGYSLNEIIHPWNVAKYGWPHASEWKFALPLATGSYAWFPCSLAIGAAGIASLRRRASGIIVVLAIGFVAFEAYYQHIDLGRGVDWGYGPRYELPFVVHMAVGMGIALAPLATSSRTVGPITLAVSAMIVTVVRLWPLLYPGVYTYVHQHDSLNARIREMHLKNAVVMTQVGAVGIDPLDLTENRPIDLYPNQDALIAIERKPEFTQCIRRNFPSRTIYRASGNPVMITPY
jgi:hypothetical protein